MTNDSGSSGLITSRGEFHDALRAALSDAANHGARELWLCDNDFADWPLGERAVVETFAQWAATHRRLTLVARHFDDVARRHARWVEWRRVWSHIVTCRTNTELPSGEFPTVLVAPGTVSVRLSDAVHHRGRLSHDRGEALRCKEMIDAVLQHSEEAFPASVTGL